jgi:glutamate dehydrogenase
MFALARSSWADYDAAKISAGGGVFPRSAKSIVLSPEARTMLGITAERTDPTTIMRAILKLPVQLLYFGGIGTYIKASHETQAEAGDRANDALRIDGRELRCKVLGEGANLGITQAGRVEGALAGVRIDTDALHNSAGVDTSDHEVNLKILLGGAVAAGDLTLKRRDVLLKDMTDDVGAHVLRTNFQQALAVSLDQAEGAAGLAAQLRLMAILEAAGKLDRAVAGLPDDTTAQARGHLTRPDLAVLLPYAKLWLSEALLDSALPDDAALADDLAEYFPPRLRTEFATGIAQHRLRRELVATLLTNDLMNRLGPAAFARLTDETGAPAHEIARAALVVRDAYGLPDLCAEIEAAPVDEATRVQWLARLRRLHATVTRKLVPDMRPPQAAIDALRPAVAALVPKAGTLEQRVAALAALAHAPDIVALADAAGLELGRAESLWTAVGQGFALDSLRQAATGVQAAGRFAGRAVAAVEDDLAALQRRLTTAVLAAAPQAEAQEAVEAFRAASGARVAAASALVAEAAAAPDLAGVVVAARALAVLA